MVVDILMANVIGLKDQQHFTYLNQNAIRQVYSSYRVKAQFSLLNC